MEKWNKLQLFQLYAQKYTINPQAVELKDYNY